jgi:chromate transporter
VERRRWISERRFLHALNYCMVLPGPEAQQLATYIGWLMHRTWGGIVAGVLFVLPSLFILIALSWVYVAFGDVPVVAGLSTASSRPWRHRAARRLAHRLAGPEEQAGCGPSPGGVRRHLRLQCAVPGHRGRPRRARLMGGRMRRTGSSPAAATAAGKHLRPGADRRRHAAAAACALQRWTGWMRVVAVGLLWAARWELLAAFGWQGTLTQMGWFFTKAALLTFGGAYAVLPYVYQGGVEHYGWLTPTR